MTLTFIIIATVIFFLLGVAWKTSDFINTLLKVVLLSMSIFGLLLILLQAGLVIIR